MTDNKQSLLAYLDARIAYHKQQIELRQERLNSGRAWHPEVIEAIIEKLKDQCQELEDVRAKVLEVYAAISKQAQTPMQGAYLMLSPRAVLPLIGEFPQEQQAPTKQVVWHSPEYDGSPDVGFSVEEKRA